MLNWNLHQQFLLIFLKRSIYLNTWKFQCNGNIHWIKGCEKGSLALNPFYWLNRCWAVFLKTPHCLDFSAGSIYKRLTYSCLCILSLNIRKFNTEKPLICAWCRSCSKGVYLWDVLNLCLFDGPCQAFSSCKPERI